LRSFADTPHDQRVNAFPVDLDPLSIPNPTPQDPREIRAGDT
jgi:hypothetical protein